MLDWANQIDNAAKRLLSTPVRAKKTPIRAAANPTRAPLVPLISMLARGTGANSNGNGHFFASAHPPPLVNSTLISGDGGCIDIASGMPDGRFFRSHRTQIVIM